MDRVRNRRVFVSKWAYRDSLSFSFIITQAGANINTIKFIH